MNSGPVSEIVFVPWASGPLRADSVSVSRSTSRIADVTASSRRRSAGTGGQWTASSMLPPCHSRLSVVAVKTARPFGRASRCVKHPAPHGRGWSSTSVPSGNEAARWSAASGMPPTASSYTWTSIRPSPAAIPTVISPARPAARAITPSIGAGPRRDAVSARAIAGGPRPARTAVTVRMAARTRTSIVVRIRSARSAPRQRHSGALRRRASPPPGRGPP